MVSNRYDAGDKKLFKKFFPQSDVAKHIINCRITPDRFFEVYKDEFPEKAVSLCSTSLTLPFKLTTLRYLSACSFSSG
jgi:hypothetical protein